MSKKAIDKEKYKQIKTFIRPGDVLLSINNENIFSGLIKKVTNSEWSHTFMYIGHGNIVESTIGGVQITSLKHYMEKEYNIAVLRCDKIDDKQSKRVVKNTLKMLGKGYAYGQILWYLILRIIGKSESPKWQLDFNKSNVVCSEAIAYAFLNIGIDIKPGFHPAGVEPGDFWESKHFVRLYSDIKEIK